MINIKQLEIVPIVTNPLKRWYMANGYINNKHVIGYGNSHFNALLDAFKDYQVIINLK